MAETAVKQNPLSSLWIDSSDALSQLANLSRRGLITAEETNQLRELIRYGFTIIPGAISDTAIDVLAVAIDNVLSGRECRQMTYWDQDGQHHLENASYDKMMEKEAKLLDIHNMRATHDLIFAPSLKRFLELIFDSPGLAFQSLYFERGSEQGIHQDTAFVPIAEKPLDFVASWIALEDVQPGTGELIYLPESHRLPDLHFKHGKRCLSDDPLIFQYNQLVEDNYTRAGLKPVRFLPKRGDVLIWAADLCHGGSPIEKPGATRRSLVTHYCPLNRRPLYATGPGHVVNPTQPGGYVINQY